MLAEVLDGLRPTPGGCYLDGTVGGGGHAEAILRASDPDGRLLGLDRDVAALARCRRRLAPFGARAVLAHGSFRDMATLADRHGFGKFDGIFLDLGFSSDQMDDPSRGFAFQVEGPLDMRLDASSDSGSGSDTDSGFNTGSDTDLGSSSDTGSGGAPTAAQLVNNLPESELADLIYHYGEERRSRRIARTIVAARPLSTTTELAAVVSRAVGGRGGRIHPATQTFQALRIAVNDELGALSAALPQAIDRLRPGGRLVVISFHSLEDRIVKQTLAEAARDCICPPGLPVCRCEHQATMRLTPRRALKPSAAEVAANPRARSAKLRVAERLDARTDRSGQQS